MTDILQPLTLLKPMVEEDVHPWEPSPHLSFDVPFLRVWDDMSGSQPDIYDGMTARASRQPLDTFQTRKSFLSIHVNHRRWEATPFISFSTSPREIEKLANFRMTRPYRKRQRLTVVDANIRLEARMPVFNMAFEMDYYGVRNPYEESNVSFQDHWVCVWQVDPKEIVGHWDWDDLADNPNWYEEIILPEFREFRLRRSQESGVSADLSQMMGYLNLTTDSADDARSESQNDSSSFTQEQQSNGSIILAGATSEDSGAEPTGTSERDETEHAVSAAERE